MILSKALATTVDRSQGEEVKLAGTGFVISGQLPPDLEIAVNDPNGARYPVGEYHSWSTAPFTSLFVYHSPQSTGKALKVTAFSELSRPIAAPVTAPDGEWTRLTGAAGARIQITATGTVQYLAGVPGKRIRLLTFEYFVRGDSVVTGGNDINLAVYQSGVQAFSEDFYVPSAAANTLGGYKQIIPFGPKGLLLPALGGNLEMSIPFAFFAGGLMVSGLYRYE